MSQICASASLNSFDAGRYSAFSSCLCIMSLVRKGPEAEVFTNSDPAGASWDKIWNFTSQLHLLLSQNFVYILANWPRFKYANPAGFLNDLHSDDKATMRKALWYFFLVDTISYNCSVWISFCWFARAPGIISIHVALHGATRHLLYMPNILLAVPVCTEPLDVHRSLSLGYFHTEETSQMSAKWFYRCISDGHGEKKDRNRNHTKYKNIICGLCLCVEIYIWCTLLLHIGSCPTYSKGSKL